MWLNFWWLQDEDVDKSDASDKQVENNEDDEVDKMS